jgi:group II intron reverse transcriptase/maturase
MSSPQNVSTKLERIATLAKQMRGAVLTSLSHHIDVEWLHEAYRRTRKDGATGIDGQTAAEYAENLEENLRVLLDRAKTGDHYRAPPVRRVHIPKGDGRKTRPIGIPTFEDKVLQRAVAMALEAVYEQDFNDCSYGFRPGRSAHDALQALWEATMSMGGGWVLEADIESFFDSVDRGKLQEVLRQRVRDGVLTRLVGKWLNAGVMEEGRLWHPESGTPQGGVISPLLANIYLHEVLDEWFERDVRPRLSGRAVLLRYADDFVVIFAREKDARRVMDVLPKRFGKYGLKLHPEKTRLVPFRKPEDSRSSSGSGSDGEGTFDLLGFTHHWGRSLKGNWVVKRKTACTRLTRALRRIRLWCRVNRHEPLVNQHRTLVRKVKGHYGYYGITGNGRALSNFVRSVERAWKKWLGRRNNKGLSWARAMKLLAVFPLPRPRIVHSALRRASESVT